jgi:hypothetical protein
MRIDELLKTKQTYSYEIFPPKGTMPLADARKGGRSARSGPS